MSNSTESWLLLIVSLPTNSASARMRVWRAVKAHGCAALPDGAYLLPDAGDHRYLLQQLLAEAEREGGSGWLLRAAEGRARSPVPSGPVRPRRRIPRIPVRAGGRPALLACNAWGAMVHAPDVGGSFVAEAAGFEAMLNGARRRARNDDQLLAQMSGVLDALYAHFAGDASPNTKE